MRKTVTILAATVFLSVSAQTTEAGANKQVYRIMAASCGPKNERFSQAGFRAMVQGQVGLVTALHGVVGCGMVIAVQEDELGGSEILDLQRSKVSVPHDVIFFTSASLDVESGNPLRATSATNAPNLRVVGYPLESVLQLDHTINFYDNPRRTLNDQFKGSSTIAKLAFRGSPSTTEVILMVQGTLQNGLSGAPLLTPSGAVVGIANGGLAQGFAQINWAVPFAGLPWVSYSESDQKIQRLIGMDAASLFHSPWSASTEVPQTGARITGRIYYDGQPVTSVSKAYAVIKLVEVASWRATPIDFQYNNMTGEFTVLDVPPGKYMPSVRLESGYPFHIESGGDFHARNSDINKDLVVTPHDTNLHVNWEVMQGIHLTRPIDNQTRRTNTTDPPENFYPSFYAPSAELFEWDPVPGAAQYQVVILTVRQTGQPPLHVIDQRVTQPRFGPGLGISPPGTHYMFRVEAYSPENKHIGTFNNYYKNGSEGWLSFRVVPPPHTGVGGKM